MKRTIYESEHESLREAFRAFLDAEAVPNIEKWEQAGQVDRSFHQKAGENGFLGFEVPEEYGGQGLKDFRYNAVMSEEVVASGMAGDTFTMHNDILAPYLLSLTNDEQKQRWLPRFTDGSMITALGMTEPGAGSDVAAIRTSAVLDGDEYVINGQQDVHHQRGDLRSRRGLGPHGRERRPRHVVARGRGRHARLRQGPADAQGRPQGPGHRRAVLQRLPGAGREPDR